jgi:tRNA threonylcarbamoyl adenosine modification protein YjeE
MSQVLGDFNLKEDEMHKLLPLVASSLSQKKPFCLWLIGDVGAGKSSFVRAFLKHKGLPQHIPVTSPTFTHMNTYTIGKEKFAHFDFYRGGPKLHESMPDDFDEFSGLLVEWPEAEEKVDEWLKPTHQLLIDFADDLGTRHYRLEQLTT